jgi:hypothetical protein
MTACYKKKIPLNYAARGIYWLLAISHLLSRGGITELSVLAFLIKSGLQQAVLRRTHTGLQSEPSNILFVYKDTLKNIKLQEVFFTPD